MMPNSEANRVVRWSVILLLSAATAGMAAVSMRANYLFGYGFGQTPEKATVFGWANVAADVWKIAGLILITSLWRAGRRRYALILLPIWVTCLAWGIAGAVGVYAQDRTALVGGRELTATTYRDAQRELATVDQKLAALNVERTVAQIDAAIAALFARPVIVGDRMRGTVGRLSANCTKDDRTTVEVCAEIARLREERTAAQYVAHLEEVRATLRLKIEKLGESGGALPPDPVAELFAWLSGGQLSVRDIGFGFPLVFAFLIEFVSAFGPAGIAAYAEATRRAYAGQSPSLPAMARSGELRLAPARTSANGRVVEWIANRTEPALDDAGITLETLFADYEVWCFTTDERALSRDAFAEELDQLRAVPELAGKIRKTGNRYYGIRLLAARALVER